MPGEFEMSPEARKQQLLMQRDGMRENASELESAVTEIQVAKYEIALRRLMQRTDNNPEIVNALNQLLSRLDNQSHFGISDEKMPPTHVTELAQAILDSAELIAHTE
jgi:CII-binding regulator of phage lambda lysogenization HflD